MRISKANQKLQQQLAAQRQVQHFGLRKLSVGVASVLLSTSLYFGAASVAHAATGTPSGEAASVDTETVTSGVANQESTATLTQSTANEAPVDDEVTSAADQKTPSSAVDLKDATPVGDRGGAPAGDEVTSVADQTTPSSAVDLKDARPSVNRRVALKALVKPTVASTEGADSKVAAKSQYDVDDIYNFYHDKSGISKDHIQKLVDYKNNLASVAAILELDQTAYGSNWVNQALEKQVATPETFTDAYVDKIVSTISQKLVKDTNQKIDAQLDKLATLQEQYPNNLGVKKAIDELTNAKAMVTPDTILDANRMESVIETLNKYSPGGNNQALDEAKKNAKAAIENLKNLNQAQKEAALAQVEAATTVDAANDYANTATTLDGVMKDLADTAAGADTTSGNYTNADAAKQDALQKAIAAAQTLAQSTTEAADADKVEAAKQAIEAAQAALNGNDKLAQAKTKANETINGLKNLNQAQKEAALAQVEAATDPAAVSAAQDTATTLDGKMGELKTAVNQAKQAQGTGNYTNADTAAQQALNDALTSGEGITANGNTPVDTVDAAIKTLTEAMNKLNGDTKLAATKTAVKEVINGLTNLNQAQKEAALAQVEAATTVDEAKNYATTAITLDDTMGALQKAVTDGNNGKVADPKYYNADATTRAAYDKALSNAQAVLDDANATQAQIDQAKADLAQAAEALTGKATDKSALQATYNQANVAAKTTAYTNANDTIKRAYEKALGEAQAVLADANATQAQVDLAKATLDEIMALLKGASGDATVAKNSSDQSDQNGLSKAATAIDGENTTSTTSSASKQNQLPQTGAADDASLVAAGLGLTLASMLLGLGAKLKRRQN